MLVRATGGGMIEQAKGERFIRDISRGRGPSEHDGSINEKNGTKDTVPDLGEDLGMTKKQAEQSKLEKLVEG